MPPKRKRRVSPSPKGLAPGERLKRSTLPDNNSSRWGWVGTEVHSTSGITPEHRLISCGLSRRNNHPFCPNKYSPSSQQTLATQPVPNLKNVTPTGGEQEDDDIIIISDDEGPTCSRKNCKYNPNCLNYLGQEEWENEDEALEAFLKVTVLEDDPTLDTREPDYPVGLKVWFRDLAFRSGVYNCTQSDSSNPKYKESPIFQLQVTFSALQESIQSCFNPVKLVESLQLRTTEQQDAQEFSKLFMSHLDAEFRKQADPRVKSLVTDQFQGTQVYGTICNRCTYRSERASNFLEIEINLKNNAKLEDRIEAVLKPEILSGDNKYLCSQCDSLQDATRYTQLTQLPPVLHFSLLRFVYDLTTMERKKSKHSVSFPKTLDMNPFMQSPSSAPETNACGANLYELHGVLLHKGSSAYHGHYEAQVFDEAKKSWYQFNDETVTKIKALGDKPRNKPIIVDDDFVEKSHNRKQQLNVQKRRLVESEDDDFPPMSVNVKPTEYISSKDAYMLIYARKMDSAASHSLSNGDTKLQPPMPPPGAMEIVNALNSSHDEACELYQTKTKSVKTQFLTRRKNVVDIYHNWNVDHMDTDTVLVSRQALSSWLSQLRGKAASAIATDESEGKKGGQQISLEDIICVHGAVDPSKANNIKRIKRSAYLDIVNKTGWDFDPHLTVFDICVDCVQRSFQVEERLYQVEHSRSVARFDQIADFASDCSGFWISKPWLKDWRLAKPKMHVESEGDPAPDSANFVSDVLCEHGALSLSATSRRRISFEAVQLLQKLYPSWSPLSTDSELCSVCDANVHISRENKRETRKQAEDEKAKLKTLHDLLLLEESSMAEDVPCALIPISFAQAWKKWLNRPTDFPRPERVDNTSFICKHDMLAIDPNIPSELDAFAMLVPRSDWDILASIYPADPLISITKSPQVEGISSAYTHTPMVCAGCRIQRKTGWTSTEIFIRLNDTKAKVKKGVSGSKKGATYSSFGARQSRRLRQIKELGEKRRFTILKSTTVKDIKVMIQGELEIPTICQRLFHGDKELNDNTATVESLEIFAHDVLDLRREIEVVELDSDPEEQRRPREEERGFHGTLLGKSSPSPDDGMGEGIPCGACTFSNEAGALTCMVCDTVLT